MKKFLKSEFELGNEVYYLNTAYDESEADLITKLKPEQSGKTLWEIQLLIKSIEQGNIVIVTDNECSLDKKLVKRYLKRIK